MRGPDGKTLAGNYLQESQLPLEKSLTNFDLNRLSCKEVNLVQTLRTGPFLARRVKVLVFTNPGRGKTYLV